MQIPYELILGWRYTRAGRATRRNGFISFISGVSMLGIALGVAALIIVLSVMNGFQKEVRDRMLGVVSHIEIFAPNGAALPDVTLTLREARANPQVIGAAPFIGTQALLARGEDMKGTIVRGIDPAREPEVTDLAHLLVAMGAKIDGIGTDRLVIEGVEALHGARHAVISDRIEAATFLCAVAAAGGDVTLTNTRSDILDVALDKLREVGLILTTGPDWIRAQMAGRPKPVSFRTTEYPGFPTDMQAQFMAVDTIAAGTSRVTETIFENRFMHVQEMNRLGASIQIEGNTAFIKGVDKLVGAPVMATDLRASASLVIAALAAQGQTIIDRIYHLDRGYDRMEVKLSAVGADIVRIK